MTNPFRTRMLIIGGAFVLMLATAGRMAHVAWRRADELRGHFDRVEHENARITERLHIGIQTLDASLLRDKLNGDNTTRSSFDDQVSGMRRWIADERAELRDPIETRILDAIEVQFTEYLHEAGEFAARGKPAGLDPTLEAPLEAITRRSENILALGFDLAEAHTRTLEADFSGAAQSISSLEWLTFASLGLTVAAGTGVAWVIFRDYIAPLRSELQESRSQLERQEKLAALGVLSAGIAHEIRNPLTAVKARLFTLQRAISRGSEAAEDVRVIDGEVDRLARIVGDFLQFARPPEPNLRPCEPRGILERVRELLQPQYLRHTLSVESAGEMSIRADADQIVQVVVNLVRNAAEATPDGGAIEMRAMPGADRRTVRIEVSDQGPGIPPEARARLFDPFFTTKPSGTGLGLALSARIVQKHGGSIHFDTAPDRGTRFTLEIPADTP